MPEEINFNSKEYQDPKERRNYVRIPFQKHLKYNICYNKFHSEEINAASENISEGGILFKTKWPPPSMSIIAIDVDIPKFKAYIKKEHHDKDIDVDAIHQEKGRLFGEVIRITEYKESGFYDVALKFIPRKTKKNKKKR